MKKTLSLLVVAVLLAASLLTLCACSQKLSGKYEAKAFGAVVCTYEFDGDKVTIYTPRVLGQEIRIEGTYKIKDDKITFTFEDEDEDVKKYDGTFDFEEKEDSIKIGLIEYEKKD